MNKELAVSFALAVAIVGGVLWMLDGQYAQMVKGVPQASSSPMPQPQPAIEDPVSYAPAHQPETVVQDSTRKPGQILRCVVNGRTIYSDEKCPNGTESKELVLHHAAGIVSPPKAVLSELTAQRKAAELAAERERELQQRVARTSQSKQAECQWLEKQIEHLDSLARQPQAGYTQDRIKEEKAAARSRQFAIHC